MDFKQFFAYWKESVDILRWKNLKLILLASLNNFCRSLFTTVKYFWWMVLILPFIKSAMAIFFWTLAIQFICVLGTRASIEIKNVRYFAKYCPQFWGVFLFNFMFPPVGWFSSFFFMDSSNSTQNFANAFKNGVKFAFCYLPLTVLLGFCIFIFTLFIQVLLGHLSVLGLVLWAVLNLLFMSITQIIFIKFKHGNYNLFFEN